MSGSNFAHRRGPSVAIAILVATLLAGLLPLPLAAAATGPAPRAVHAVPPAGSVSAVPAAPDAAPDADADAPGQLPSIAYTEAMAHADDEIVFEPGGLVVEGFTPRSTDRWPIDGKVPGSLPGGRATGRQMAVSPQGSRWTDVSRGGSPGSKPGDARDPKPSSGPDPASDPVTTSPGDPTPGDASAPPDAGASPDASPEMTPAPIDAPAGDPVTPAVGAAYIDAREPTFDLAASSGLRRQVFGFLPYWELSGASTKLDYDVLSTIAYFSVGANARGDLRKRDADGTSTTGWGGWTSSSMTSVINAAHHRGTRVVLTVSVFAWTSTQAGVQRSILGSSTARLNLARQAAAAVRDRGADGVNLDFEPLASGYADEFVLFLKAMRSELNKVRSGYQLTYDTTGFIGNYPLEASVRPGAADAIFIMGYDYRTAGSGTVGSIDPLSGPKYDLTDTVRTYKARVSPSRLILGLPWYGRAWSTTSDDVGASSQSGAKYGYSTAVNYSSLTGLVARYGRRWDPVEQSPYVAYRRENCTGTYGCVTSWRQVYYDDGDSLKRRLAMVNDYGLRGAGMWALGYDGGHPELYGAISESFLVDRSAPRAGIRLLAATQADEGFVVAWAAKDTSSVVSYDVQVSARGGAWTGWRNATTATSDVWLGGDGIGYAFRVRARDSKGNTGSWNVTSTWDGSPSLAPGGFGRVTLDGLAYRTGPDTAAAKLGSLPAGTIVAVTRGPVSSDGYAWYEVTQPVREWGPVSFVERGVWVAARSSTATHVAAYRAPNSTRVDAGLAGLDFGSGASALGTTATAMAARAFSPNGDGSEDTIRLRWTNTRAMGTLTLKVYRPNGSLAGSVSVPALAAGAQAWTWNGKLGGTRVKDGRYMLQLVGTASGRTYTAPSARPVTAAQVAAYAVSVDTVAPVVSSASVSSSLVSSNGDGTLDSLKLALSASGAIRWTVRVANAAGTAVRTVSGTGGSAAFTWSGTGDAGTRVPDGRYSAVLSAYDAAGNRASRAFAVTVDTVGPALKARASQPIFSPNGDGAADATVLAWTANEKATGTARVYRGTTLVRSWTVRGVSAWSASWNGRTAAGTAVADGRYTFGVSVKDAAGNGRSANAPVVVDRTARSLRWSRDFFPQDRDALLPTAALTWSLTRSATTTLRLYDARGALVRTVWSRKAHGAGSRGWTWDGRLADGTYVAQGRYTARLTVTSSLGTQDLSRPVWVAGFAVTPSATRVVPGQTLTVRFATIEPLAVRPKVTFMQPGRAGAAVTATRLADGTYRASFKVATGAAGAGSVRISAKDSGGHTNAMLVAVTIGAR